MPSVHLNRLGVLVSQWRAVSKISRAHESERGEAIADRSVVVLEATNPPDGTTRYIDQIVTFAPPDIHFRYLSPRQLVFGRFDVIHFHWPEVLIRARSILFSYLRCVFLLLVLVRLKLCRVGIVRTVHNLEPHEPGGRFERWTLQRLDRATDHFVTINEVTQVPNGLGTYIPLAHYRDRFATFAHHEVVPGRITYAGLIRPYKGIERLMACFQDLTDPALSLRIVGRSTAEFTTAIDLVVAEDPRVSARLEFVPDQDLVSEVTQAEFVCLPYEELHNSGMLLVALSLDKPVLVPTSLTTTALNAEVGDGWIYRYQGELTPKILAETLKQVQDSSPANRPRLDGRDWEVVAASYATLFRHAAAKGGPSTSE
jgi:beta-1,4-mannosyltransferase